MEWEIMSVVVMMFLRPVSRIGEGSSLEEDTADSNDRDKSHECCQESLRQTERGLTSKYLMRALSLLWQTRDERRNKPDFKGTL
jgi:hypothetical protein